MKTTSKVSFIALVHTILFFLITFLIGIFTCKIPYVFESSKPIYRMLSGLSLALEWFPSILLSGVVLGFSRAFASFDTKNVLRFSPVLMKNFKGVLRISLVGAIICFSIAEIVVPFVSTNQNQLKNLATDFDWYQNMAQNCLDRQQFSDAYFYNNTALTIAGNDKEHSQIAKDFGEKLEINNLQFTNMLAQQEYNESRELDKLSHKYESIIPTGKTAIDLLNAARAAYENKDYFGAHYNATLAASISDQGNPNRPEMLQLASKAWNMLAESSSNLDPESESLFAQKRIGYDAIINHDVLKAYYTFHNLQKKYPVDPDVKKYGEIAKKMLKEQYFFFEETAFVKHFEVARNVYFTIPRADGGKWLLYIRGISVVKNTGDVIQYLRGLNIISYSKENKMEMKCRVPFAKLKGASIASFSGDISFEGLSSDEIVPVILLNSVSQDNVNIQSNPVYEFAEGVPKTERQFLVLPISLKRFNSACSASAGAKVMSLFDLVPFSNKAEEYGFSNAVFGTEMLSRLCYPFVILFLFVISAILGWNYRLRFGELFKFSWIFIFPIAIVLSRIVLEFLFYGLSILYFLLYNKLGLGSLFLIVVIVVLAVCLAGFRFLGLHGENYYEDTKIEDED
ncbi:MAG: hypothetical protein BKP49_07320 [Treponema sp. CETP13]|nr:MAG: hypothetical protein BKP49_07320 [Treponema sp. CETP13]